MAKLKVYRTAIGFHDAYVAAPSQKAALEAWGGDTNLFSAGMAELVTDEALSAEPLANPGKVIKRVRGSTEEHVAALGEMPAKPKAKRAEAPAETPAEKPAKATKPAKPPKAAKLKPRPSRAKLDAAEAAIAEAESAYVRKVAEIAAREAALRRERKQLEQAHERELATLETRREKAAADHRDALKKWRES